MALNILSINKFERTNERQPNYIADVELNGLFVKCDIYTNARLRFNDCLKIMEIQDFKQLILIFQN